MHVDDPQSWAQAATAFKGIFDGLRSAIAMVKELRSSGGNSEAQQKLVDQALDQASKATQIAEAEVARALGYELCRCEFPPTAMLAVGNMSIHGKFGESKVVYECPKCHTTTAGPWAFNRTATLPAET